MQPSRSSPASWPLASPLAAPAAPFLSSGEPGETGAPAARLLEALAGLDLASADGRAGIRTLLAEIERLSPGAILQQAASIELRRVGWTGGRTGGEASGVGR